MKATFLILVLAVLSFSCYHEDDYLPTNLDPNQVIIDLYANETEIIANGSSYTYIVAELPTDAVDARSNVVFSTTKGTFENGTKTTTQQAALQNIDGVNKRIVKIKLISSSRIESADITATVAGVSKTVTVAFTNQPYDEYLVLNSTAPSIFADGATYTFVTVEQPIDISDALTSITFTTTSGTFENGTRTITKSSIITLVNGNYVRTAKVKLISSKIVETATVDATIIGTSKSLDVAFTNAFPESINITVSAIALQSGFNNNVTITTQLLRSTGTPSVNNEITLEVVDGNDVSHGNFINYNIKSNSEGKVINVFTLGADEYEGQLYIKARTYSQQNELIEDTYTITAI